MKGFVNALKYIVGSFCSLFAFCFIICTLAPNFSLGEKLIALTLGVVLAVIAIFLFKSARKFEKEVQKQFIINNSKTSNTTESESQTIYSNPLFDINIETKYEPFVKPTEQMKQDYQSALNYYKNSSNPKFHRTERESELSYQFTCNHSDDLLNYENQLEEAIQATHNYNLPLEKQIENCNEVIKIWDKFKKFCYRTKGGTIYFQDMWEFCHNSKHPQFEYIYDVRQRLEVLLEEQRDWSDYEEIDNSNDTIIN